MKPCKIQEFWEIQICRACIDVPVLLHSILELLSNTLFSSSFLSNFAQKKLEEILFSSFFHSSRKKPISSGSFRTLILRNKISHWKLHYRVELTCILQRNTSTVYIQTTYNSFACCWVVSCIVLIFVLWAVFSLFFVCVCVFFFFRNWFVSRKLHVTEEEKLNGSWRCIYQVSMIGTFIIIINSCFNFIYRVNILEVFHRYLPCLHNKIHKL